MKRTTVWAASFVVLAGCSGKGQGASANGGASSSSTSASASGTGGTAVSTSSTGTTSTGSMPSSTTTGSTATSTSATSSTSSGGPSSCTIGGQVYAAGTLDPNNACMTCNPTASTVAWSNAPDGQGCGPGSQCAAGACVVPQPPTCSVHVPGDYATIQGAITALRAAGTAGTVCVADGTYAEALNGDFGTAPLLVTGTSAAKVKVNGNVKIPNFLGYPAPITFANMSIHGSVQSNKSFGLSACAVDGGLQISLSDYYSAGYVPTTVLIDESDLSAPGNTDTIGVSYAPNTCGGALNVTVTNSYLHGAETGLAIAFGSCGSGKVDFLHNTVQGLTGIYVGGSNASVAGRFVSNLITGSTTGIMETQVYGDFHDNALFGNTSNYSGVAAPGMGYVTSNPMLTSATPPGPGVGSPLIAAGDPALVTARDFHGVNRNGRADIGAVEGP